VIVLKKMCEGVASVQEARRYHVQELAAALGADGDEVERSLYVLEGHKFVAPHPAGDFTSKTWQVTEGGLHAVQNLPEASAGLRLVLEWV
jgi:hypothetical protein